MVKKLTEEQQKIVDYSYIHGIKETTKVFPVNYDHVSYLRQKGLRYKEQLESQNNNNGFYEIPVQKAIEANDKKETNKDEKEMISLSVHGNTFMISKDDFKKVFFND